MMPNVRMRSVSVMRRPTLLVVVLVVVVVVGFLSTSSAASARFPPSDLSALIAQLDVRFRRQTPSQCVGECARQMREKVKNVLPSHNDYLALGHGYTDEQLGALCGIHCAAVNCLKNCSNTEEKGGLFRRLSALKYICHDSNYTINAACLRDVHIQTAPLCDSENKCGLYSQKVDHYLNNVPQEIAGIKDMMKQTCLLVKCTLDCAKPTVISTCGQSAQNDREGIAGKIIQHLKFQLRRAYLSGAYAPECDHFVE